MSPPGRLVSEEIKPLLDSVDAGRAAIPGEPMLPAVFKWRDAEYPVEELIESWKETGPCTHGSGERYVQRHWYRIRTNGGDEMKIYFERKARSAREAKKRWWLYTFTPGSAECP